MSSPPPISQLSRIVAVEIRAELTAKRLPQKRLAELLGRSIGYVSARLMVHVPFTVDELEVIVDFLSPNISTAHWIARAFDRWVDEID